MLYLGRLHQSIQDDYFGCLWLLLQSELFWSPLTNWTSQTFLIANLRHSVSKSRQRPCQWHRVNRQISLSMRGISHATFCFSKEQQPLYVPWQCSDCAICTPVCRSDAQLARNVQHLEVEVDVTYPVLFNIVICFGKSDITGTIMQAWPLQAWMGYCILPFIMDLTHPLTQLGISRWSTH